jgi:hypothetical protein
MFHSVPPAMILLQAMQARPLLEPQANSQFGNILTAVR